MCRAVFLNRAPTAKHTLIISFGHKTAAAPVVITNLQVRINLSMIDARSTLPLSGGCLRKIFDRVRGAELVEGFSNSASGTSGADEASAKLPHR